MKAKERKAVVRWEHEEIKFLAEIVRKKRWTDPVTSLVILVNNAQKKMPEDRRRKIVSNVALKPIIEAIAVANSLEQAELADLRDKPEVKVVERKVGREEVLNALSEESIITLLLQKQNARAKTLHEDIKAMLKGNSHNGGRIDNLIGHVKEGNTYLKKMNTYLAGLVRNNGNGDK